MLLIEMLRQLFPKKTTCPACGAFLARGQKGCPRCGYGLGAAKATAKSSKVDSPTVAGAAEKSSH